MVRPNLSAVGVLLVSVIAWGVLAEGGYRLTHHGHGGLRHALYAKAATLAHRLERAV